MSKVQDALTAQLLEWIEATPRSYSEVIDAWKTSCPRLSIWEDACIEGLVDCHSVHAGTVFFTDKGKCFIKQHPVG